MLSSGNFVMGVVAPYFNFFLFLLVLVYFSRKPLAALALSKKEAFDIGAREATELFARAQTELKETKDRLSQLDEEIAKMKKDARSEAIEEERRQEKESKEAVERVKMDAKRAVASEELRAQEELRREVFLLVRRAVEDKVTATFSEEKQKQLISKRVEELNNQYAGNISP